MNKWLHKTKPRHRGRVSDSPESGPGSSNLPNVGPTNFQRCEHLHNWRPCGFLKEKGTGQRKAVSGKGSFEGERLGGQGTLLSRSPPESSYFIKWGLSLPLLYCPPQVSVTCCIDSVSETATSWFHSPFLPCLLLNVCPERFLYFRGFCVIGQA